MIARLLEIVDSAKRSTTASAHEASSFGSVQDSDAISPDEYESWLLPPEPRTAGEKLMQGLSEVAGWLALIAAGTGLYLLLG